MTDQPIHDVLAFCVTALAVTYALLFLLARLRRSRPDLSITAPVLAGLAVRVLSAVLVSATGLASTLRGGDEVGFLSQAEGIASAPLGSVEWTNVILNQLHVAVFAGQLYLFDSPEFVLRITQAGIAMAGLLLLAVAAYELAGPRAALIAAWLLALEPTGIFFGSLLHKESIMLLAVGLVAFGGAKMWKRGELVDLFPILLGCLIAVATRPYAGWFLIAAGAAITLHAGLRGSRERGELRPVVLVAIVVLFSAVAAPTVWEASSDESLQQTVQESQDANVSDDDANLALEEVDFSSREAIVFNLPSRMRDVVFKPFPWQLQNTSQQVGALGTIIVYALFAYLTFVLLRSRGAIMERAGPLIYIGLFVLVAYSLSAGNAGTAFRYRTHVTALALVILVTLAIALAWRSERRPPGALTAGASIGPPSAPPQTMIDPTEPSHEGSSQGDGGGESAERHHDSAPPSGRRVEGLSDALKQLADAEARATEAKRAQAAAERKLREAEQRGVAAERGSRSERPAESSPGDVDERVAELEAQTAAAAERIRTAERNLDAEAERLRADAKQHIARRSEQAQEDADRRVAETEERLGAQTRKLEAELEEARDALRDAIARAESAERRATEADQSVGPRPGE